MNKLSTKVRQLSIILRDIQIDTFCYMRVNRHGQLLVLSNNERAGQYFAQIKDIGDFFRDAIKNTNPKHMRISLWPQPDLDPTLKKLTDLNIANGLSVALRINGYAEIFSFAATPDKTNVVNFCVNYFGLLKRFIIYFKNRLKPVIDDAFKELAIALDKSVVFSEHSLMDAAPSKILPDTRGNKNTKVILKCRAGTVQLTHKELGYLYALSEGKSMKAIADEFGVSARTIESRIEGIKSKTGCTSKAELLRLFFECYIEKK